MKSTLKVNNRPKPPGKSLRRRRHPQLSMLPNANSAYGGALRNTRAGRKHSRPISSKDSMHLVLRSTAAKGSWSFLKPANAAKINAIIAKFAFVYGVKILSMANVGNHLHLHLRLNTRLEYKPFIRAITGAIAMAVTGRTRWSSSRANQSNTSPKFWDLRPFTRIVIGFKALLQVKDYIRFNQLEAWGMSKTAAREIHRQMRARGSPEHG
ncbi:MAG: transposase [Bdellovibrionales bacterium]|nr:transposase [Bdellovibrionales bacterium]